MTPVWLRFFVVTLLRGNAELLLWSLGVQQALFRAGMSLAESGQFDAAIDYYRLLSTTASQHNRAT